MPSSSKSRVILSISNHHEQHDDFSKDRFMDDANGSCKGKNLECVSGCSERNLRRKLDDEDDETNCSQDACYAGSNVREGGCVERVSNSLSSDRTNKGSYTSTKPTQASKMQWPKWTVSHMLSLSSMEQVMNYYRVLNLADNLNDEDLRCFLEEQLSKEKAGLSETTITNRLRTRLHVSETVREPDSCSICMIEYKDQDKIASLYYCSHEYHADCIKEWLLKNNLCPMCRALAVIPEDYPCWDGDVRLHQAFFVHLKLAV
ncbi:uncharacterized protein LOC110751758 isoform X2 [Prunus avium]|uniref:RING-type E3 ubiquitin transferase n=1 Tax=Prunus avium TaxID=42229 RepID=A0A6P5RSU9_PRUAV|nr:uncharacterized protein LOC110751758 isoform X2 [Prunus avium]